MLYAKDAFEFKATVSNGENNKFVVIGEEPLANRIRGLILHNDPVSLHCGSLLECVAAVLRTNGIDCDLDQEDISSPVEGDGELVLY